MKIHEVDQGSVDWLILRSGKVSASELDALISPFWKVREGDGVKTYLAQKLAEWWMGGNLTSFATFDMDQGKILEEEARPWLSMHLDKDIAKVGFITTDDDRTGCSPDGLIDGSIGVEIKCPQPTQHVRTLLNDEVPKEHLAQLHGGMFVTGAKEWIFCSYRRGFPNFVKTVQRDENAQEKIAEAVSGFIELMDEAIRTLEGINGGPPRRRHVQIPLPQPEPRFFSETPS